MCVLFFCSNDAVLDFKVFRTTRRITRKTKTVALYKQLARLY